jgi:hypothetical protein
MRHPFQGSPHEDEWLIDSISFLTLFKLSPYKLNIIINSGFLLSERKAISPKRKSLPL